MPIPKTSAEPIARKAGKSALMSEGLAKRIGASEKRIWRQRSGEAESIRRRIAHRLEGFGCQNALDWPEAHPIDLDSMQLVELALHIEAEFDIDFRDDLIPPAPSLGDFVDMVEAALRQKGVDTYKRVAS